MQQELIVYHASQGDTYHFMGGCNNAIAPSNIRLGTGERKPCPTCFEAVSKDLKRFDGLIKALIGKR